MVLVIAVTALWLGSITLVVLVLVRQTALLTARLEMSGPRLGTPEDGIELGRPVPNEVLALLPNLDPGPHYLLTLSAVCLPCRELVAQLGRRPRGIAMTALLSGSGEPAAVLDRLMPADVQVVRDPDAARLSGLLGVKSTPFVMQIREGQVRGKAFLHGVSDLERLVQASRRVESGQEAHAEVTGHVH